ncbi:FtsX-like permease family protein [Actinoplanes rectilineatus]|uniref:FtsX-like permease family protein n=1 Tax=Actinoplanes rectilineatus TaxID=113571 RepID=UPI0005F2C65F|nr:FtsX-like permease family protein [Actinoplanes rectilineatus]
MKAPVLVRLSLAGNRTDRLRTGLTVVSSALAGLALMSAAVVASISGGEWIDQGDGGSIMLQDDFRYTSPLLNEAGLRPGVAFVLIMLAIPVLALAAQSIRLGAPARDRRLAALRLNGATPRETVLIAGAETAVASLLGSILGFGALLVLRVLLERRDRMNRLVLPTDVLPHPLVIIAVLLVVPVLAGVISAVLMRRVVVTPLGVVRRIRERGPKPWPGIVIVLGLVLFALPTLLKRDDALVEFLTDLRLPAPQRTLSIQLMIAGVLLVTAGIVLGTGWISYAAGRLLRRFGRGPATLMAGARLMADPWNGSRTTGALIAAVIVGAGTLAYRQMMSTEFAAMDRFNALTGPEDGGAGYAAEPEFYLGAARLVMVAVVVGLAVAAAGVLIAMVEGIVARRRTYAAMTAGGVPRGILGRVLLWRTVTPLVPALLLAIGAGTGLVRMLETEVSYGGGYDVCTDGTTDLSTCATKYIEYPDVVMPVPVPWADLALLGGGALAAMLLVVGVSVLVLRSNTDLEELRVG